MMIRSFLELVLEFDNKYKEYICTRSPKVPDEFCELIREENLENRNILWEKIVDRLNKSENKSRIVNRIVNPYYIGFGNPESNILFVGQKLAFNREKRLDL
jgi:hypothetical protein